MDLTNEFQDALGNVRPYRTKPLPFSVGMPLFLRLAEIVGATVGTGVGAAASSMRLADLNFSGLGEALAMLPSKLYGVDGGMGLVTQLLSATERGQYMPAGEIAWAPLSRASLIDAAYTGNYVEAFDALAWVLRVNYAPFLTALWARWGKHLLAVAPIKPISISEPKPEADASKG